MTVQNPISAKTRSVFYLITIIVGAVATVVGPVLAAFQVSSGVSAIVISLVGAITTISSTLSRANLTISTTDSVEATPSITTVSPAENEDNENKVM